jgi:putative addiction module component (TIGR02574 family)
MASTAIDFERLNTSEKILWLQDLWDRIAERPETVEVTESQRQELDRRLAASERAPEAGIPWNQVKATLRKRG